MSELKRKLTIIFYADVAGYSRLMGLDEEGSHRRVMAILDATTETIRGSGGEVLRYAGDAILATFSSVISAVETSVKIQERISSANQNIAGDRHVQVRIGLNLGDVIEDVGDVDTIAKNLAPVFYHIAEIKAYTNLHMHVSFDILVGCGNPFLNRNGSLDGTDDAGKGRQDSISRIS